MHCNDDSAYLTVFCKVCDKVILDTNTHEAPHYGELLLTQIQAAAASHTH